MILGYSGQAALRREQGDITHESRKSGARRDSCCQAKLVNKFFLLQLLFVFHTMAPRVLNWYRDSKLIYYNYLSILRSLKLVKELSAQHDIEVFLDTIGHLNQGTFPAITHIQFHLKGHNQGCNKKFFNTILASTLHWQIKIERCSRNTYIFKM